MISSVVAWLQTDQEGWRRVYIGSHLVHVSEAHAMRLKSSSVSWSGAETGTSSSPGFLDPFPPLNLAKASHCWQYGHCRFALPADGSAPPGLFTAIQEQIGLKLEPMKAPTEVLVVDAVQRPSAN